MASEVKSRKVHLSTPEKSKEGRTFQFDISKGQEGFLEGFLLAARFADAKPTLDGKEPEYGLISEVSDPLNFGLNMGWRFSLAKPGKYRVYYTTNPYVLKGVQSYLEKFPGSVITLIDVYDFNTSREGGEFVQMEKIPPHVVTVDLEDTKKRYTLEHGAERDRLYIDGEGIIDLDAPHIQADRNFLDSIQESIPEVFYHFLTKAFATGLKGLPTKLTAKVVSGAVAGLALKGVEAYQKLAKIEDLKSPILADYLADVL